MTTTTKNRDYVRPIPATWWLKNPTYTLFMVRELTAVFIALYCIFLLRLLYVASHTEPAGFDAFIQDQVNTPVMYTLHFIALVFALFNTVTFLNLTPRVVVIQRGEERVPDSIVVGLHYAMFAASTIGIIFLAVAAGRHWMA